MLFAVYRRSFVLWRLLSIIPANLISCGNCRRHLVVCRPLSVVSHNMIKIVFPEYQFKIKKENDKEFIFDEVRKQWVKLTPEEWVRQNFLQYLIDEKKYPPSLMAVEKEIKLNDLRKRCDIVVYNRQLQPWLMVECKSMEEPLNEKVAAQILRYQIALPVNYLIITNGQYCYGFKKDGDALKEISELPNYSS